jgi:hypothetical protein
MENFSLSQEVWHVLLVLGLAWIGGCAALALCAVRDLIRQSKKAETLTGEHPAAARQAWDCRRDPDYGLGDVTEDDYVYESMRHDSVVQAALAHPIPIRTNLHSHTPYHPTPRIARFHYASTSMAPTEAAPSRSCPILACSEAQDWK